MNFFGIVIGVKKQLPTSKEVKIKEKKVLSKVYFGVITRITKNNTAIIDNIYLRDEKVFMRTPYTEVDNTTLKGKVGDKVGYRLDNSKNLLDLHIVPTEYIRETQAAVDAVCTPLRVIPEAELLGWINGVNTTGLNTDEQKVSNACDFLTEHFGTSWACWTFGDKKYYAVPEECCSTVVTKR